MFPFQAPFASPTQADYRVGLRTLEEETAVDALALRGELPAWLRGSLVRVTPAMLDVGGAPVGHWFDGLAMLHAFGFRDGQVSYANRFLRSREFGHVREHGEFRGRTFGTDPCRSLFRRVTALFSPHITDNCNVNVTELGDRWIAMTEAPIAIEFDKATLATLGPIDWSPIPGEHHGSAHPHHDARTGQLVSYHVRFGATSSYRLTTATPGRRERRVVASVPVREPAYMHSFALTERHCVLFEQPLRLNPARLVLGRPFIKNYRWKPERGFRFLIVERSTGELSGVVESEPFFTFHQVNSFERDGELVLDLVAYEDASVIDDLYLERMRDAPPATCAGRLRRYRLPLGGGMTRGEDLCDAALELPRIAYDTHNGRPYRYAYCASQEGPEFIDKLAKVDVCDGSTLEWRDRDCFPGEPVFVPSPGAEGEDSGAVLSVVLDAAAGRSFLLVLDAESFEELARAEAPHHIPFGFHGDFAPDRTPEA